MSAAEQRRLKANCMKVLKEHENLDLSQYKKYFLEFQKYNEGLKVENNLLMPDDIIQERNYLSRSQEKEKVLITKHLQKLRRDATP